MATEETNGHPGSSGANGTSVASDTMLPASERMKLKHEADEAHRVTIEDVVDEYDDKHPKLSSDVSIPTTQTMSAKAAGKQKAADPPPRKSVVELDTQSHDLFPSLGAGAPKSRASPAVAPAWGTKKSSISDASVLGMANGDGAHSLNASIPSLTGPPLPASTIAPAPRPAQAQRGPVPQPMSIPGKYSERISLLPQEMKSRSQLNKPIPNILQDINRRSKAKITMMSGGTGAVHFDAKGPVDAVRQALREVAREVGSKQSTKVSVPASVRPLIIGRQGAIIQGISQRTGARIQVPRPEEGAGTPGEDDDEDAIEVVIEGDSVAAAMARREIENIVNERTSNVQLRLKDIPAEFYPFLAGPHNARISTLEEGRDVRVQVPHQHVWRTAPPPPPPANERPAFRPATEDFIKLSGDRMAVQEVRAELERQVQELRRQITLSQLDINRGQHQFVVGSRGTSLHDFLEETGCIVLLPPVEDDTETLTIIGPPECIEQGVNKVMDLATSMQMTNVDISRQHPNAPDGPIAHARHVTRYLQQRGEIQRLERLYDAHITLPTLDDGPVMWEIYSRDAKNNIRARTEIVNLVNGQPPSRLTPFDVDPFYHAHVREQSAAMLRDELGVHLVFPPAREEHPQVLMVFEGTSGVQTEQELPRRQPSAAEAQEATQVLGRARQHLVDLLGQQAEVVSKTVDVHAKFHEKVQRFTERELQQNKSGEIPVRVQFGPRGGRAAPSKGSSIDAPIALRGPAERVDAMAERILQFVEEEKANEKERDHVTTFDYPQKFANFLIGKRGENIRKYREEFDVEIQVNDGKVEIKGPPMKAEQAKKRILELSRKLEDEASFTLKIKPQYHRELIGAKGSQVNRLQDRYNVRVNFPRSAQATPAGEDGASEAGAARPGRTPQAPDEVIIRGPRKAAEEAKDELLSLLQWAVDHAHTATISVAKSQLPSLIGQGGREMEQLRLTTGAQIDVPDHKHSGGDGEARAEVRVRGTAKQVADAKALLTERAKIFDESVTRTIEVDKRHHKALIGPSGSTLRDLVVRAGGPDDRRELARMVRFPRQNSDETAIKVEGHHTIVDRIVAAIEAIIKQREEQVTTTMDVAPEKHRLLIGRGGEIRRKLESQFKVVIEIPKVDSTGDTSSGVRITGLPTEVACCQDHITGMIKGQEGETIQVPRRVHHKISDQGQFFRRLRNEHKVTVDHDGHQPPPRPTRSSNTPITQPRDATSLPLITDDVSTSENISWTIVHDHDNDNDNDNDKDNDKDEDQTDEKESTIPWVLRGSPENVRKARALVERAVSQAGQPSSTGYLILADPRSYRHVIGPGGSQVNAIRKQTGCQVMVPRDQAKGEAIEIKGGPDGVTEAKEMILEVVRNAAGRRGGARE